VDRISESLPDLSAMTKAMIDPKFIRYARTKFPNISDELINRNVCEIITACDAESKCKACMGVDMCAELINSAGYTYKMILQPSGWIKTEYVPCEFNGGREFTDNKVSKFTQGDVFYE